MTKIQIKKGDTVEVIAGKYKGKKGKVTQVFPKLQKIVVDGVNNYKKHLRSRTADQKGQIIEFNMPIHVSNVMLLDASGKKIRHNKRAKE